MSHLRGQIANTTLIPRVRPMTSACIFHGRPTMCRYTLFDRKVEIHTVKLSRVAGQTAGDFIIAASVFDQQCGVAEKALMRTIRSLFYPLHHGLCGSVGRFASALSTCLYNPAKSLFSVFHTISKSTLKYPCATALRIW